jgi:hypothetical protein
MRRRYDPILQASLQYAFLDRGASGRNSFPQKPQRFTPA